MLTGLLNNILFMIFPIFLYQVFWEPKGIRNTRPAYTILGSFSLILCMSIPVLTPNEQLFDFRQTALIITSLYGGYVSVVTLSTIMIVFRWLMDGESMFGMLFTLGLLLPPLLVLIPKFLQLSPKRRMAWTVALSTYTVALTSFAFWFQYPDRPFLISPAHVALGLSVQMLGTWMIVFFIEVMMRNKIIRREMQQVEKLRVISELAASVSHEVRNPLTVSRGFIQLLLQRAGRDPQEIRYLNLALEELDRAQGIITDYLAFARPELEKMEALRVTEDIAYAAGVLQPYALLREVEVITEYAGDGSVKGDRQKLRQCLINLFKNGIEAMPDGGQLHIQTELSGSTICIHIRDSGSGMTVEQLERLGTPYYTTKAKGTGLGTMVSYSIVKAMNGRIDVESAKGKGTVFTIKLPLLEQGD